LISSISISRSLVGHRFGRFHNQVGLPRNHFITGLAAAVAVRLAETRNRRARHEERLQHAVFDGGRWPRLHSFVVVIVPAVKVLARRGVPRGIENHRQETGQHLGADALGEGLPLVFILLAVAFDAMAEDFVKEHARRAAGENRRVPRTARLRARCSSAVTSLATRSIAASTVLSSGRSSASSASKLSKLATSAPSAALAEAEMKMRA
jgi:hypothetical protein